MKKIYVGGKEVPIKATGFTTILFKRFTGNDLMSVLADTSRAAEKINDVLSLFYCMNVQAREENIGDMFNVVSDVTDYYEFLNGLESKDLYAEKTMTAIMQAWIQSSQQSSEPKNA